MGVFDREMEMYQKVLPLLNKIGSIDFCPVVYVNNTEGQEALVLEHMKQFGWKDALNKKEGLRYRLRDNVENHPNCCNLKLLFFLYEL